MIEWLYPLRFLGRSDYLSAISVLKISVLSLSQRLWTELGAIAISKA
jgi:hypothetical protein